MAGKAEWICRVAVVSEHGLFTVYAVYHCDSETSALIVDYPDLDLGSCNDPEAGGCYQDVAMVKKIRDGGGGKRGIYATDDVRDKVNSYNKRYPELAIRVS